MKIKEVLEFTYRGKKVTAKVIRMDYDGFVGELLTDYIGKNESWYCGDTKWFQSNLIRL